MKNKAMEMEDSPLPLHVCKVDKLSIIINRSHSLVHCIAIAFLIYYRAKTRVETPLLPWLLVFGGELILSFIWVLGLGFGWRTISRTVFPERLPKDDKLPAIDVFICTADPKKEPTVEVMNTVLSAMALDYPAEKLHVYVSDDGGSSITLLGMREAWRFATSWLPFCKKYGIQTICPKAYFSSPQNGDSEIAEFFSDRQKIEEKYELFKEKVMEIAREEMRGEDKNIRSDHPSVIEVINEKCSESTEEFNMPLLVYVSREKMSSHPHHFKAGALNVLFRVSGVMSNSPYVLVLDCDMYCNDPTSARQAMCFNLDPKISSSLGFIQFPQKFHNACENDIYDSQLRYLFSLRWHGLDGLVGPVLSGTNFFMKREALYGNSIEKGIDLTELRIYFGSSNEFLKSVRDYKPRTNCRDSAHTLLEETKILASCAYENNSKWGQEVGFMYHSVVEDVFTGFTLHCKGWKSVYLSPSRPQFLGSVTTSLNDALVQSSRWSSGLVQIGISRFCPLIYGATRMPLLQSMAYAELTLFPLYFLPVWCFATIPQLCLLNGIPLYPKVSSSFSIIFFFIFISSSAKCLYDILVTGGTIQIWRNEQRIWMIKSVTCHLYACLDSIMEKLGLRKVSFLPTNKVADDEEVKRYQMGIFNFQTSTMFLAPMVTLIILNMVSFVWGLIRMIITGDGDKMLGQVFLSFYILVMNYAIIEGMILRKDTGRIPASVTLKSAIFSVIFLTLGSIILEVVSGI